MLNLGLCWKTQELADRAGMLSQNTGAVCLSDGGGKGERCTLEMFKYRVYGGIFRAVRQGYLAR